MNMPPGILARLLAGEHFNVEERKALGLWPSETLRYSEVVEHLANALESKDWFPQSPDVPDKGSAVREGIYVHQQAPNRFVCVAQRTRADDPATLARKLKRSSNRHAPLLSIT